MVKKRVCNDFGMISLKQWTLTEFALRDQKFKKLQIYWFQN